MSGCIISHDINFKEVNLKFKHVPFPDELFKRLEDEKKASGIVSNSIVIIAVTEYLTKKEKDRSK